MKETKRIKMAEDEDTRSMRTYPLSETNLGMHDATFQQTDRWFQENLIREERARVMERELFREKHGSEEAVDIDDLPIDSENPQDVTERSDVLKMYPGPLASSETPMNRFMTVSPAHDSHPWLSKDAMDAVGINHGDLETLELRRLAAEFAPLSDAQSDSRPEGSPRPSSPTLSITALIKPPPRRQGGPRVQKRIGLRRRNSLGQMAARGPRPPPSLSREPSKTSLDS